MQATVSVEDAGTPLHKFVRRHFSVLVPSRSQTHVAFKAGQILVNGAPAAEGLRLRADDIVSIARTVAHVARARSNNVGVRAVHCDARVVVVWKSAGVSMDPRSAIFSDAVRDRANLAPGSELYPLLDLDKAVSGLVVLSTCNPSSIPSTINSLESTYRCIVHGRVGSAEGLTEGSEYAVEFPIRGTLCSTLFRIVSFTSTRNSPDGWLTTLDATPVGGFVHKQVMTHLYSSDHPVIGNSRMTKQHRTCRDKGIFCSLIKLSFSHPDTGETLSFIESEPSKFEALRLKEAKFSERKLAEIEEATQSLTVKRIKSNELPETEAAGTNNAVAADDEEEDDDAVGQSQSSFKNAAYIRGSQEFRGLLFKVSPAVMIPRASSGILVESAVSVFLEKNSGLQKSITILDMGTGSGSLLISTVAHLAASLLKNGMSETDCVSGIALDASSEALAVTRENLDAHGLSSRVKIHLGTFGSVSDIFSNVTASKPVQIILCNPPYLSPRIKKVTSIDASLLNEEPAVALFSGDTGLEAYQEIMGGIRLADDQFGYKGFSKHCVLVLEIGHGCSERVKKIFVDGICSVELEKSGRRWEFVALKRDHRKLERCLIFHKLEGNRILEETFRERFSRTDEPEKLFLTIHDFDGVSYSVETKDSKSVVYLSMSMKCYPELRQYGADNILFREYGALFQQTAEPGFDVTLRIDETQLGAVNKDELVKKLALLKRNALAAPFEAAFYAQSQGQQTNIMTVNYRDQEAIYIMGFPDRVTVIFSTVFKEETDQIFGRVFLQEFVDARRQPAIQNAPQVLYSPREPPLELRGLRLSDAENIGYVTFVLFPRHFTPGPIREDTISRIQLFRDYLHYHIKASKAYMHSRMRARVESFLKVLNRAKPEKPEDQKEKKTMAGKTFKR
ncbi:hypothetical protein HDU78_003137 [Chytriomyces hyalinus]|nr:hypothetical protein HDU78_003137 [Chytriomyces hyalinus]